MKARVLTPIVSRSSVAALSCTLIPVTTVVSVCTPIRWKPLQHDFLKCINDDDEGMASMNRSILLAAAGLLFSLHTPITLAASVDEAQRAIAAGNYAKALSELEQPVKNQDPAALYLLGQMYENGWGVAQSTEEARRYYERGAQQGTWRA